MVYGGLCAKAVCRRRAENWNELSRSGGRAPGCGSMLSDCCWVGWDDCWSNLGTGGLAAAARSSGASFSLLLLWLPSGAFSASGKEISTSVFSGSLAGCGGVEATTSGSMVEDGRGAGSGSLGRGNSVWTICARRQRVLCFVIRDWHARRHIHRAASSAQSPACEAIRRCRKSAMCQLISK